MTKKETKKRIHIKKDYKLQNAITLIALIITIIVLLILAGVTINLLIGPHNIFLVAEEAKRLSKIADIQERLELEKIDIFTEKLGEVTIEEYLEHIQKKGIIKEEDIQPTEQEYAKRITVEEKYVFLIEEEDDGNIKITYEGEVGELKPNIEISVKEVTAQTITVEVSVKRMKKVEYSYYIKDIETGEEYKLEATKEESEYKFEGLTPNKEYKIKVIAKNEYGETPKETEIIRTKEAYKVIYNINTDNIKEQLCLKGESVLETTFTPEIQGWEFIGWREDNLAQAEVISEKQMEESQITLYAVFRKTITLSYNANGGTSTPAKQTGIRYYNNGNTTNPSFTLAAAIARSGYTFQKWRLNSTSGTAYNAKGKITLSSNATMYATWTANSVTVAVTSLDGAVSPTSGTVSVQSGSYSTYNTSYFTYDPKGTGKSIVKIAGTYKITWSIKSSVYGDYETNCTFYKNSSAVQTMAASSNLQQSGTFNVTLAVGDTWHVNYLRRSNAGITFRFTMQKI